MNKKENLITIEDLKLEINYKLDEIYNKHYPVYYNDKILYAELLKTYRTDTAIQLLKSISSETPFKRIWTMFLYFNDLLLDFIDIVEDTLAIDRIMNSHKENHIDIPSKNQEAFNEEYQAFVKDCIEILWRLNEIKIFFDYFIPTNIQNWPANCFNMENFKYFYKLINDILTKWSITQDYNMTLNIIRCTDLHKINNIIQLIGVKQILKKSYPSLRINYSKKKYYRKLHQLIIMLKKYNQALEFDNDLVNMDSKKKFSGLSLKKNKLKYQIL